MVWLLLTFLLMGLASGKVYQRCELAKELKVVHRVPEDKLAIWVCIAQHESSFNTTKRSPPNRDGSRDHGLFQINDKYWCSPPGRGCGQPCAKFRDDVIADDYACIQKIYEETKRNKRNKGDGFKAWTTYERYCKDGKAKAYIKDCF